MEMTIVIVILLWAFAAAHYAGPEEMPEDEDPLRPRDPLLDLWAKQDPLSPLYPDPLEPPDPLSYGPPPAPYEAPASALPGDPSPSALDGGYRAADLGVGNTPTDALLEQAEAAAEVQGLDLSPEDGLDQQLDELEAAIEGDNPADDLAEEAGHDTSQTLDEIEDEAERLGDAAEAWHADSEAADEWTPPSPDQTPKPTSPRRPGPSSKEAPIVQEPDDFPRPDYSAPRGFHPGAAPIHHSGVTNDPTTYACEKHGQVQLLDCHDCDDYEPEEDEDGNETCKYLGEPEESDD